MELTFHLHILHSLHPVPVLRTGVLLCSVQAGRWEWEMQKNFSRFSINFPLSVSLLIFLPPGPEPCRGVLISTYFEEDGLDREQWEAYIRIPFGHYPNPKPTRGLPLGIKCTQHPSQKKSRSSFPSVRESFINFWILKFYSQLSPPYCSQDQARIFYFCFFTLFWYR